MDFQEAFRLPAIKEVQDIFSVRIKSQKIKSEGKKLVDRAMGHRKTE